MSALFDSIISKHFPSLKITHPPALDYMPGVARVDRPMSQAPLLRVMMRSEATKRQRDAVYQRLTTEYAGYGCTMIGDEIRVWGLGS